MKLNNDNAKRSYFAFNEYRECFLILNDKRKNPSHGQIHDKVREEWEKEYHDSDDDDPPEYNQLVIVDWEKKTVEMDGMY